MNPSTIGRRWTWGRFTRAFWVTRNGLDPCRPADRVLLNEAWILEGRQYFDRPRNGIQSDFRFIYTPIRTTLYKKSPVKVADNRPHPPLSLHSIHTLFPSSLSRYRLKSEFHAIWINTRQTWRNEMRARIFVKLDLGNNSRAREGSGICRIDVSRQACIRSLEPEVGDGVFHGASNSSGSAKNRRNRSLARGISELGRVSRRRQRGKVARKFDTVEANFSSPPPLFFGGEKSVEDLARPHLVRFDGWVKTDEWYAGGGRVNLDLDLTHSKNIVVLSNPLSLLFYPSLRFNIFRDKIDSMIGLDGMNRYNRLIARNWSGYFYFILKRTALSWILTFADLAFYLFIQAPNTFNLSRRILIGKSRAKVLGPERKETSGFLFR